MEDKLQKINFWERLENFVKCVNVNDPMSDEEKEMILSICKENKTMKTKEISYMLIPAIKLPNDEKLILKDYILEVVANELCVSISDVLGKKRNRQLVMARQYAMAIMYDFNIANLTEIGVYFGKDHSTVFHSIEKIKTLCEVYQKEKSIFEKLNKLVRDKIYESSH